MAYADKYTAKFYDRSGDPVTIKIQQNGYGGAAEDLTLAENPLTISMPVRGDIFENRIMGLGCQIRIINTDPTTNEARPLNYYDELFATAERNHKVIISKVSGLVTFTLFEGFILPAIHQQQIRDRSMIIIPANGQLQTLQNYRTGLLEDTSAFSSLTLISLLQDILNNTGLELPVYIKNTLFSTLYASSFNINTTCYDRLQVNRQIFIDEDEITDGWEILEMILKVTYSRLYYYDGKWIIDRLRDCHQTNAYKTYPYSGSPSSDTLVHADFELDDTQAVFGMGSLEYQAGKRNYQVTIDFDKYDNLLDPSFVGIQNNVTIAALPEPIIGLWKTWTTSIMTNTSYSSINVFQGLHFEKGITITTAQFRYMPITSRFMIDVDDTFSLAISYLYDNLISGSWPATFKGGFRIRYKVGDAWRFFTGVGGTTIVNARIEDVDWGALNDFNYSIVADDVGGANPHRWRIVRDGSDIWMTTFSAVKYGTKTFFEVTLDPDFDQFDADILNQDHIVIPGKPDWDVTLYDGDERASGIYEQIDANNYSMIPLHTVTEAEITEISAESRILKVSEIIAVTDIKATIDSDLSNPEQVEMYIDIMPVLNADIVQASQKIGDILIEQNSEISNNVITGVLNTDFQETLETGLKIYDGDYVNYKNTLLVEDSSSKVVRSRDWRDDHSDSGDTSQKLHYILIRDQAQQFNSARHRITMDLVLEAGQVISPGSKFTFTGPLTGKIFIVIGSDYNVRMNAWRLTLTEHKDYDNFDIV